MLIRTELRKANAWGNLYGYTAAGRQAGILSSSQMFNLVHRGTHSFKAEDDLDPIN